MKIYCAHFILLAFVALPSFAQSTKSEPKKAPNVSNSYTEPTYARPAQRKPMTVTQIEKQTGGKVIGARPVNVQGQQLNQIKILLPNGRIIIPQQLFDENGRSVETVIDVERVPEIETKYTDD